jgi:hypothetical protein
VPVASRLAHVLAVLALLACAAPVQAVGFSASLPFTDFAAADHLPILSGSLDVTAPAGSAATLMHNVSAFEVSGLAVVCWDYPCHRAAGPLSVRVAAGSTVALRYPQTGDLHLVAEHAVVTPVDLDSQKAGFSDLSAGMSLAPSLIAATQGSRLVFDTKLLPAAPDGPVPAQAPPGLPPQAQQYFQAPDPDDTAGAVLAALTAGSRLQVLDGGQVVHDVSGYSGLILQGAIQVEPIAAEAFVLPCAIRCDLDVTTQGGPADLKRATASIVALAELAQGAPLPPVDLGPFTDLLDPLADGVYVDLPLLADPGQFSIKDLTVARFDSFHAALQPGAAPAPGDGQLVIQSGSVQGSPEFVGGRYFGMPLWSWVLWAAAIVAIVVAAVVRAPKASERWDHLRIVGWVLGAIAWALLAYFWNANFGQVIGVSATSSGLSGTSRMLVLAVEGVTLLAMALMVVLPARLLLSRLFRLARQGRFMGLAGPLATGVGILAGLPLLLGLVDLALRFAQ